MRNVLLMLLPGVLGKPSLGVSMPQNSVSYHLQSIEGALHSCFVAILHLVTCKLLLRHSKFSIGLLYSLDLARLRPTILLCCSEGVLISQLY